MPTAIATTRRPHDSERTRQSLLDATARLLIRDGFAGATSRAIAKEANCNQGLIAYHFGGINALLLLVLDRSSAARLQQYESLLADAHTLKDLRAVSRQLYRQDRDSGHVKILAELVAGGLMDRRLGETVAARVTPWVRLTENALRTATPSALRRRLPIRELAYAVVAMFLGLELLGNLRGDYTDGDQVVQHLTAERLFRANRA